LRAISKSQTSRPYCTKHTLHKKHLKNAKRRNKTQLQNTVTRSQNSHKTCFAKFRCKNNTAKRTQNAHKRHKTLTIQPQYVLHAFGVFSQNTFDLRSVSGYGLTRSLAHNTQYTRKFKLRGGCHVRTRSRASRSRIVDVFQKTVLFCVLRCFAVFCGVLRCFGFVCVFLAFFYKTAHNDIRPQKYTKRTKRTKYALCFVQYNAIRCCASFSHSENLVVL